MRVIYIINIILLLLLGEIEANAGETVDNPLQSPEGDEERHDHDDHDDNHHHDHDDDHAHDEEL